MDESLLVEYPDMEQNHFWWVSRRELVTELVLNCSKEPRHRILDVGCGTGVLAVELGRKGLNVLGIDVEFGDLRSSSASSVRFVQADYLSECGTLGKFDGVLALDVVEHFENESRVIKSLFENTKPGGMAIITVPAYRSLWTIHDDKNNHFRRYTRQQLASALRVGGFSVDRCGYLFFGLLAPKALLAGAERVGWRSTSHGTRLGERANAVALSYFRFENRVATSRQNFLPAGTSVIAVCIRQ